jgi:hypothetical protein
MPVATIEPEVKAPIDQEIELLKDEIRELYPRSQIMRLEIGAKLLELQAKLAHYGDGNFIQTVVSELHIPKSTCYELMEFARVKEDPESLSTDETNFEEEQDPEKQTHYGGRAAHSSRQYDKVYPRKTQIHIAVSEATREKIKKAVAKINAAGPEAVKQLSRAITREVFRAAAKVKA